MSHTVYSTLHATNIRVGTYTCDMPQPYATIDYVAPTTTRVVQHPDIHLIETSPTSHPNPASAHFDLATTILQFVNVAYTMVHLSPDTIYDHERIVLL